ncbi:MAG: PaaI family thioesterase [Gammaproteobacteria bacterium]|nr:PaaI family thioesterase [Gammaproteobacteria bacterium]MDH3372151.1 PaaI family thioesterase [Gammaproteobacteria bacterium]MDH3408830.1 PaaI family thioesterase [Gammaproteobacteria bacterium]
MAYSRFTALTANYNTDFAHLTGLERMRHFEKHAHERFGIAKFLNYDLERVETGDVMLRYKPDSEHLNLFVTVHGGVLASLLDTVMGCALMTMLDAGEQHTIIDLHTKFLRPVTLDSEPLRVFGHVDHRGRRQCTMNGKIITSDDKLCATGIATAMIL